MKQRVRHNNGFTLIELLVVIAIIGLLSSVVLASLNSARTKAQDSERVQTLKAFETALELYYDDFGKYPSYQSYGGSGFGSNSYCYTTYDTGPDGMCGTPPNPIVLSYENSASVGFLKGLKVNSYISEGEWNDPLNPTIDPDEDNLKWNCRYIVPQTQAAADNIQQYALHCRLASQTSLSQNDGGSNPNLYEIQKPNMWVCIEDKSDTNNTSSYCN